ncbi:hypothetical protein AK812_SmicGene20433 [Symbiodinium microadriaticum]|uniref:Uncharacterized protein n=1 Tax=Symbiodinium microadriaticum TaxID=2951 RepID=A0A1Q9DQ05_SYMMI|nr:hypothetical protein AK812_SmicGene20433 [Symbiodinium microadriaticum]
MRSETRTRSCQQLDAQLKRQECSVACLKLMTALLQLATFGEAQLVFMFPQRNGESALREQQPAHMTFSKISAMGSDGQMHSETHKVDCKDGDCSKSVSFFGHLPGMFSSMAPTNIFKGMPRTTQMELPEKMKFLMHRMHHHCHHMVHHMMIRFRGGADDQKMPQMPVQRMSLHFLAPTANIVQMQAPPVEEAEEPVPVGETVPVEFQVIAGLGFVSFVVIFIALARMCLFGKAQARERPLQALGQPLAPEAQAELGLAEGVAVPPQSLADFVKMPATPTQAPKS